MGAHQEEVSNEACVIYGHGNLCKGREKSMATGPWQMSVQPVQMYAGVYAELSIIRGFFESTEELIAKGLVTAHQSIIAFAVSSRREECGDAISDEPHLIFRPPSSKNVWRSLMVRTLLFNSHLEDV